MNKIISCIFSLIYCFILLVVRKCEAFNAEAISTHLCTSVKLSKHSRKISGYKEAYSAAGGMGFGWWLVEHYLSYHVDCPDGCGLGESTRGR